MNPTVGFIREKTGRTVFKAFLVRKAHSESKARIYYVIAGKYFSPHETLWKFKKDRTYELHLGNTSLQRGEARVQYIDYDSGNPVSLEQITTVAYSPQVLFKMMATEHIKQAVQSAKGMNTGLVIGIILFSFGAVVGLLIGMNLDTITGAAPK